MYGTIARMRIKPGMAEEMRRTLEEFAREDVTGFLGTYVYRTDRDPNEYYMVVMFDSAESYRANAESPQQHERYLAYMRFLDGEPEWHDGEIVAQVMPS